LQTANRACSAKSLGQAFGRTAIRHPRHSYGARLAFHNAGIDSAQKLSHLALRNQAAAPWRYV